MSWFRHTLGADDHPSFIWLHGWGHNHKTMMRLADLFRNDGSHILFDQPGFGQTPMLGAGAGTADYADALATDLAPSETKHIFIGHSFGGRVSIQMAARHPHLVQAIILIAGAGIPRSKTFAQKLRGKYIKTLGACARYSDKMFGTTFIKKFRDTYGSSDYKNAGDLRPTFVRVVNEDLREEAGKIDIPVLLLYGAEDTETPPEIGAKYAAAINGAEFHTLAGFGHVDILDRGAYQCEALIRQFLETRCP